MRPLSATECINPAFERTRLILFSPFRKGRSWKLSATSYLCCCGTIYFPFPLMYLAFIPAVKGFGAWAVISVVVAVLILTGLYTWIFHLCSRLQFAYFDIMVNRGEFVAPAWRKYRAQALPWTGFKFLLGVVLALVTAVPLIAYVRHLIPLFAAMPRPGQPPNPEFVQAMVGFYAGYGVLMLLFGLVFLVSSLLADFIVPSLALEDTGLKEAFRRMALLIRREPGEFTLYTLLKLGLAIAFYMAATIIWEIVFFIASLIVGAVVFLIGYLLHLAGIPHLVLFVLGSLLGVAWYLFTIVYTLMLALGPVFTFMNAYAIYFLGGRYPMLGELLERSTPPPPAPPAFPYAAPYPAYPPPPIP
jgi:hypothetical protein